MNLHNSDYSKNCRGVMDDGDPDPRNPLSPYYPSDVPTIPGGGRRWFAILWALLILLGAAYSALSVLNWV